jgi:membrane protein YqaA with SNARE-associated domain
MNIKNNTIKNNTVKKKEKAIYKQLHTSFFQLLEVIVGSVSGPEAFLCSGSGINFVRISDHISGTILGRFSYFIFRILVLLSL